MQPTPRTNIHDYLDLVKQEFPDSFRQAFEKAKKSQESDLVHIVLWQDPGYVSGGERDTQFAGLIQRNLDSKAHYDAGVEQVITGTEHIYPGYQESADIISILHLEKAFKDHRIFEPMLLELIRDLYVMEVSKPTMGDSVDFSLGFQDTYRYILLATEMAGDLPFFIKILKVVLTMEKYTVDYTVDTTLLPKVFPLSWLVPSILITRMIDHHMEYHKNTAGVVRDLDQVKRSAPELLPLFQDWVGAYMAGFTMRIPSELKQGYIDFKSSLAPSNILKSQAQQYTEIFTQVVRDTCLPLSEYANRWVFTILIQGCRLSGEEVLLFLQTIQNHPDSKKKVFFEDITFFSHVPQTSPHHVKIDGKSNNSALSIPKMFTLTSATKGISETVHIYNRKVSYIFQDKVYSLPKWATVERENDDMKPQFYFMTHLGKGNKIKVERVHIPGRHPGIGLWILVYIQSQDFKPTPVNTHVFTPLQSSNPGVSNSRTAISYPNVFTWIGSRDYPNSWLVKNRYNGINKKREISGSNYTFTTPAPGDVFEERKLMTLPQKFLECLKRARSTQSSSELDILSNELQSQRDTWYGIGVTRSLDIAWNDSDPRVTAYHIRDTLQSRLYGKRGTPSSLIDILERKNSLERRLLKRSIGRSLTIDEFIAEQHIRIKEEKVVVISQKWEKSLVQIVPYQETAIDHGILTEKLTQQIVSGEKNTSPRERRNLWGNEKWYEWYNKLELALLSIKSLRPGALKWAILKETPGKTGYIIIELPALSRFVILSNSFGYATHVFSGSFPETDHDIQISELRGERRYLGAVYFHPDHTVNWQDRLKKTIEWECRNKEILTDLWQKEYLRPENIQSIRSWDTWISAWNDACRVQEISQIDRHDDGEDLRLLGKSDKNLSLTGLIGLLGWDKYILSIEGMSVHLGEYMKRLFDRYTAPTKISNDWVIDYEQIIYALMTPRSKVLDYLSVIKPTVDDLSRWKDPDTRSRLHIPHGIQTPENLLIGLGIHPRENPTPPEIIAHIKTLISPLWIADLK